MDYYKPFQNLSFMYSAVNSAIYLRSSVNVYLPHRETLTSQDVIDKESVFYLKFGSIADPRSLQDFLYCQDFLIKIPVIIPVTYSPKEPEVTKKDILKNVEADLASKKISFYTVTTTVYKRDGSVGGQVTNTISQQGEVVIL